MDKEKDRKWTFVLYPESAPTNWKEILQNTGLEFAISPLHDRDINEATGEIKKSHYHILLCFPGPTTFNKVNNICNSLNCPIPKRVLSVVGIYRYFTHKDNPDKAQYNEEDIIQMNGFDINDITGMTSSQTIAIKKAVQKIIIDNDIQYYSDLVDFIYNNSVNDFYYVVSCNTVFFNSYITSRRKKLMSLQDN